MKHAAATVFARLPGLPGLPSLHGVLPARLVLWMAAALCGCQAMSADAPARVATPAPSLIHTITLERGCFGCADAGLLVLRRDGVATHTMAGNARQGTVDKTVQGRITAGDFNIWPVCWWPRVSSRSTTATKTRKSEMALGSRWG